MGWAAGEIEGMGKVLEVGVSRGERVGRGLG